MFSGLGGNVLAEVLAGLVTALVLSIVTPVVRLLANSNKQQRLLAFMGVTEAHRSPIIYLSTLFVVMGGSTNFRDEARSFRGAAVPGAELQVINPLQDLFDNPFLDALPASVRNFLKSLNWALHKPQVRVLSSPRERGAVESGGCIMTVGSVYYNSAAALYAETLDARLRIMDGMSVHTIDGAVFNPRTSPTAFDYALLEKVTDPATSSTVFFLAGTRTVGTVGAVHYLINEWDALAGQYGDRPFALVLAFPDPTTDPNAHLRPEVVYQVG